MLSISSDKINGFFKAVAAKFDLYIPADTVEGKADFKKWSEDVKLSAQLKTVRSAKDFFFPKTEHMVSYKFVGKEVSVEDPRKELERFCITGANTKYNKVFKFFSWVFYRNLFTNKLIAYHVLCFWKKEVFCRADCL